ncbi:Wzz/FepE/Etk N-terminal domain-containing protein [Pseudomonas sp.]|uniref:Wzz/FepE/Etk N-terminal domain-containing protein n=1 Tax=Pseudomonas sp. TaxID=306 RepID=UPI003C6153EA
MSKAQRIIQPDEVDLIALMQGVWSQRSLILISVILVGFIGLLIALFTPKEYATSSVLRPTAINDLDALNRSQVYTLPPTEALNKVGARLDSYDARFAFFNAHPELFEKFNKPGQSSEQSFELFNRNSINLVLPDPKRTELSSSIRLEMLYPDGVDGPAILNGFVDFALKMEREQISADLKIIVANRISELQGKIDAARSNYESAKDSQIAKLLEDDEVERAQLKDELAGLHLQMNVLRNNRISELTDAISVAKTLGIKHPSTPSSFANASTSSSNQIMRTEVNNQAIPLYFLGTDALEAERAILRQQSIDDLSNARIAQIRKELKMLEVNRKVEVLQQRKNEDIFLQDIDTLRSERARLHSINTDMSGLGLVSIDRRAQEPIGPQKPSKLKYLSFALVLGAFFGVMLALIRYMITDHRKKLVDLAGSTSQTTSKRPA